MYMRRRLALRAGAVVLVIFATSGSTFAAPRGDNTTPGPVSRIVQRIAKELKRVIKPLEEIAVPKG